MRAGEFGIVIGQELAMRLGSGVGDKLVLITPQATMTPVGVMPRFKRFTIVGMFRVGEGFGYYDSSVVFSYGCMTRKSYSRWVKLLVVCVLRLIIFTMLR